MVYGYHIVLPHYGFWLPNDPRGSWSEFVGCWEIARFGESTRHLEQRTLAMLTPEELALREAARQALLYPPVSLTGKQALSVANGFKEQSSKSDYAIWACSILPEHTHLVIARHRYKAEQIANLLKGAATARLIADGIHPLRQYAKPELNEIGILRRVRPPRADEAGGLYQALNCGNIRAMNVHKDADTLYATQCERRWFRVAALCRSACRGRCYPSVRDDSHCFRVTLGSPSGIPR